MSAEGARRINVGEMHDFDGDVTTLKGSNLFNTEHVEKMIGYGTGRLAKGYYILLLKHRLTEDDFVFGGTTLRSGGRLGLPASNSKEDELRPRVHDEILAEYGAVGYRMLQKKALVGIEETGENRIVKILPEIRHVKDLPPNVQYPMGGGALQWNLPRERPRPFLVAAFVDSQGHARWPEGQAVIGLGTPKGSAMIQARQTLRRYLQNA